MPTSRMHEDEFEIDAALVEGLVARQFPEWAHLPLTRFDSAGTVNAIYRLGDDLCVRLPLRPGQAAQIARDGRWLPYLAPRLPVAIPEPLAVGAASEEYPSEWAIYRWLPGESVTTARIEDPPSLALDLAAFVLTLQSVDASDGPRPSSEN